MNDPQKATKGNKRVLYCLILDRLGGHSEGQHNICTGVGRQMNGTEENARIESYCYGDLLQDKNGQK